MSKRFLIYGATVASVGLLLGLFNNFSWNTSPQLQNFIAEAQSLELKMALTTSLDLKRLLEERRRMAVNLISLQVHAATCADLQQVIPGLTSGLFNLYPVPGSITEVDGTSKEIREPFLFYCDFNTPYQVGGNSVLVSGTNGSPLQTVNNLKSFSVSAPQWPSLSSTVPTDLTLPNLDTLNFSALALRPNLNPLLHLSSKQIFAVEGGIAKFEIPYDNKIYIPKRFSLLGKNDMSAHIAGIFETIPNLAATRSFRNLESTLCLTAKMVGSQAMTATCSESTPARKYSLVKIKASEFQIRAEQGKKCLEVEGGLVTEGTKVMIADCTATSPHPKQIWKFNESAPGAQPGMLQITSVLGDVCLDIDDVKLGTKAKLVIRNCSKTKRTQYWRDSARKTNLFVKDLTPTMAWNTWYKISPDDFYPTSAPVFSTFKGRMVVAVADSQQVRVYRYFGNAKWRELLRTPLPLFAKPAPVLLGLGAIDLGNNTDTLVISAYMQNRSAFFALYSDKRMLSGWTKAGEVPNTVTLESTFSLVKSASPRTISIGLKVKDSPSIYEMTFDTVRVDLPKTCSHIEYLAENPTVSPKSFEAVQKHFSEIGKSNGACIPHEATCTVQDYLKANPTVASHDIYGQDPLSHFAAYGKDLGLCRPIIPTCTTQEYYERFPNIVAGSFIFKDDPMAHFSAKMRRETVSEKTCSPNKTQRCTEEKYREINGLASNVDAKDHYVLNPDKQACEPSLPKICDTSPIQCLSVSEFPQIITQAKLDRLNFFKQTYREESIIFQEPYSCYKYVSVPCSTGTCRKLVPGTCYRPRTNLVRTYDVYNSYVNYCRARLLDKDLCNSMINSAAQTIVDERAQCIGSLKPGDRIPKCMQNLLYLGEIVLSYRP